VVTTSALVTAAGGFYLVRLSRSGVVAAWSAYILLIGAGSVVKEMQHPPRPWTRWVIAGATVAAGLIAMTAVVRTARRSKELERFLSVEATSLAFFTTMIGVITYALLEVWVSAPRLSMWVVWTFGMFSWAAYSIVLGRRYS
jgi:hypothetical protein